MSVNPGYPEAKYPKSSENRGYREGPPGQISWEGGGFRGILEVPGVAILWQNGPGRGPGVAILWQNGPGKDPRSRMGGLGGTPEVVWTTIWRMIWASCRALGTPPAQPAMLHVANIPPDSPHRWLPVGLRTDP